MCLDDVQIITYMITYGLGGEAPLVNKASAAHGLALGFGSRCDLLYGRSPEPSGPQCPVSFNAVYIKGLSLPPPPMTTSFS